MLAGVALIAFALGLFVGHRLELARLDRRGAARHRADRQLPRLLGARRVHLPDAAADYRAALPITSISSATLRRWSALLPLLIAWSTQCAT